MYMKRGRLIMMNPTAHVKVFNFTNDHVVIERRINAFLDSVIRVDEMPDGTFANVIPILVSVEYVAIPPKGDERYGTYSALLTYDEKRL